jgi:IS30 family transposase
MPHAPRQSYTHIKKEDWSVIARMLRAGYAGAEIARTLGKDPSAVNGVEFSAWERIEEKTGMTVYFAHP